MNIGYILMLLTISQSACTQNTEKYSHNDINEITSDNQTKFSSKKNARASANQPVAGGKKGETSVTKNNEIHDLGNGFEDYGVAVPYATSRGTVTTVDQQGHKLILIWLYDHRGTYSLLLINIDSKESSQFPLPFTGDSFTSLLSSRNRYYTQFDGNFIEFDLDKRKFTFIGKTSVGTAMSMTEDDEGVIWSALSPNCSLVSYNPDTQKLTDYGSLYSEKARQLPRSIAVDSRGWIYVTAGPPGKEKIVTFNPKSRKATTLSKKPRRLSLFRAENGKVFGRTKDNTEVELYEGKKRNINSKEMKPKSYITGNQALYDRIFPDGTRVSDYVSSSSTGFLGTRKVTVKSKKTGQPKTIKFDYNTEGADIMEVATSPNGMIIGGSTFPMIFFQYNPKNGQWNRYGVYGQTNTITTQNKQVFIGSYNDGALLEWDPDQKWIVTRKNKQGTNPQYLAEAYPYISRPHDLLAYPDGHTIILAGRPSGGRSTGGLLFWDTKTKKADIFKQVDGLANQSTQSLVALPDGKILGGTTIKVGDSGGERIAKEAKLYIMDLESRKIEWSNAVIPHSRDFQDLCVGPNGLVMGIASNKIFFVFDPESHEILNEVNLPKSFGSVIPYTQGQRAFIKTPDDRIYLLLQNCILKVDTENYKVSLLAKAPEKITGGGAYLNGRIYYMGGGRNRIQSYMVPKN